jgi:hypothetical protein
MLKMRQEEYEAAVAAFVRSNGITRCPTACAVPTQGTIAPADRVALKNYVAARSRARRQKDRHSRAILCGSQSFGLAK